MKKLGMYTVVCALALVGCRSTPERPTPRPTPEPGTAKTYDQGEAPRTSTVVHGNPGGGDIEIPGPIKLDVTDLPAAWEEHVPVETLLDSTMVVGQRVLLKVKSPEADQRSRPVWVVSIRRWVKANEGEFDDSLLFKGTSRIFQGEEYEREAVESSSENAAEQISSYLLSEAGYSRAGSSRETDKLGATISGSFTETLRASFSQQSFSGKYRVEDYLELWLKKTAAGPDWALTAHILYVMPKQDARKVIADAKEAYLRDVVAKERQEVRQKLADDAEEAVKALNGAIDRSRVLGEK